MWVKNAMLGEPVAFPIQAIDMATDGLADKPAEGREAGKATR